MYYSKYQIKWKTYLLFNIFQAFAMLVTLGRDGVSQELHLLHNTAVTAWSEERNLLCSAMTEQCCCFTRHRATICCLSQNASPPVRAPAPNFEFPNPPALRTGKQQPEAWPHWGFFSLSWTAPDWGPHRESLGKINLFFPILLQLFDSHYPVTLHLQHMVLTSLFTCFWRYVVPHCRSSCLWQGQQVHCHRCLGSYFYRSHSMLSVIRSSKYSLVWKKRKDKIKHYRGTESCLTKVFGARHVCELGSSGAVQLCSHGVTPM